MLFSRSFNEVQLPETQERRPSGHVYWLLNKLPMSVYSTLIISLLLAYYVVILCATAASIFLLVHSAIQLWEDLDAKGVILTGSLLLVVLTLIATVLSKNSSVIGIPLDSERHKNIYALSEMVRSRVGAKGIRGIVLVPGWDICVYQRTSLITAPFYSERILVVGMLALEVISVTELMAVLAHEFAHFKHRDTLMANAVYRVTHSVQDLGASVTINNKENGAFQNWAAIFLLLPVILVALISRLVLFLTKPYNRRAELRADGVAVTEFGADCFASALRTLIFEEQLYTWTLATRWEADLASGTDNVYNDYRQNRAMVLQSVEDRVSDYILARQTRVDDTHPSLSERLQFTAARSKSEKFQLIQGGHQTAFEVPSPATNLLTSVHELEMQLTRLAIDPQYQPEDDDAAATGESRTTSIPPWLKTTFEVIGISLLTMAVVFIVFLILTSGRFLRVLALILGVLGARVITGTKSSKSVSRAKKF